MAKRARGSHRPGQRAPLQRSTRPSARPSTAPASAAGAAVAPRPASLTPQEEARAAELEAQIVADERAAEDARRIRTERDRGRGSAPEPAARNSLAVTAAEEYAYVGRDVRRITLIGGSLIILLIALALVTHLGGAGPI